jgi:hypothetical protein
VQLDDQTSPVGINGGTVLMNSGNVFYDDSTPRAQMCLSGTYIATTDSVLTYIGAQAKVPSGGTVTFYKPVSMMVEIIRP